jgi:N-terminal acetyltransferase B complex catalytic subunit
LTIHITRYNAYFVDLFVRISNSVAISMYEKFGYTVYRRVLEYYTGIEEEDAFGMLYMHSGISCRNGSYITPNYKIDMRKALPRDVHKQSIIPLKHPIRVEDLEW